MAVDTDRQRIFRRRDIAAEVGATVFAVVIAIVGWGADPDAVGFGFIGAGGLVFVSGLLGLRTRRRLTPEEWTALEASRRELGGRARTHANAFAQQVRHPYLVLAGGALAMTYGIAAMTLA